MRSLIAHPFVHPLYEDAMRIPAQAECPTNVSLVAEAKRLGKNLTVREAEWRGENRAALQSSNAWAEANGLPLARYRQF